MSREQPKTVGELIAELSQFPADMRVMVRGYEGGYADCPSPEVKLVDLNVNEEWYYGPHEDVREGEAGPDSVRAVIL